jgi:prepilin-type N-terminal cleavage/methylation domain-containing protein
VILCAYSDTQEVYVKPPTSPESIVSMKPVSRSYLPVYRQGGFSLVELMAVLVIGGVLVAFALPNFRDPLASTRVAGAANLFVASLDTARSESLTKNAIVAVCRSSDPMAAAPSCDSTPTATVPASDWSTGWLVFAKDPKETTASAYAPATDTLIQRVVPISGQSTGDRTRLNASPALGLIAMGPQGTRVNAAATEPVFTVEYRSDTEPVNAGAARCIRVNLMGRPDNSVMTGTSC